MTSLDFIMTALQSMNWFMCQIDINLAFLLAFLFSFSNCAGKHMNADDES